MTDSEKLQFKPIWSRLEREAGPPPKEAVKPKEAVRSPEERAEELWALWQDYKRLYLEIGRAKRKKQEPLPATSGRFETIRKALAERWHDPKVQELYKKNLERSVAERERLSPSYENYQHEERLYETASSRRDEIYQEIFKHREKEPDELTLLELAELSANIKTAKTRTEQMEKADPELASRLSFERLAEYRRQMQKEGFIWTPSREEYFAKILEHLVILNQNRPLLLYGETGTGKTRLARAVAKRLTDRSPYEVGEEAKTDIRPLLGSRAIDKEGSFVTYGQLGQALSGKRTSRDKEAGPGGLFYMDEMNSYPPDALRSLIKQVSGRRTGEEITFAAWAGEKEKLSPDFGFIGSANLPSEKHPDRPELPVEVAREIASLEVDYPPQTVENPEGYEMMLSALMDQNDRLRLPKEELAPAWKEVVEPTTNVKSFELDTDPKAGGTLWRFANLVGEIQKSYKGQENVLTPTERDASYLRAAVLDPGLVLSWLQEFRKSGLRQGLDLKTFLSDKLEVWGSQKIYPEEDRNLLKKFQEAFNLEKPEHALSYPKTILSPQEIGALSPRVPRAPEYLKAAPPPLEDKIYLPDGVEINYRPEAMGEIAPGDRLVKKGDKTKRPWTFKGVTAKGEAVLEREEGGVIVSEDELKKKWEREAGSMIIVPDALNPYREVLAENNLPALEKQEVKIDLIQTLKQDQESYRQAGLIEWAQALNGLESRLATLSPEKRKIIEQEIKDGAIPVFMPGRDTQFNLTIERLKSQIKPQWIKDGQRQTVEDTYLEWEHFLNLFQTKAKELLADIPAQPYILLTQPTQRPDPRACDKNVTEQLQELKLINQERRRQKRAPAYSQNPPEYLVLQKRFTERALLQSQLQTLNPLDKDTWTRFIHLPLSDGGAPRGDWNSGDRQRRLGRDDAENRRSNGGFRLSVRVEI